MQKYEEKIAKIIVDHYKRKKELCEKHLKDGVRHEVGLTLYLLLKKLSINVLLSLKNGELQIFKKSNLIRETKEDIIDLGPDITDDLNAINLYVVKTIQTISFLQKLENEGYIILLSDTGIKNPLTDTTISESDYSSIVDLNLIEFTQRLLHSRIIPTTGLIYIADEQNYRTDTQQALHISRWANWIAILIGVLSIFFSIVLTKCVPVIINEQQHQELIETIQTANYRHTKDNLNTNDNKSESINAYLFQQTRDNYHKTK